jgi:hypothetical protein
MDMARARQSAEPSGLGSDAVTELDAVAEQLQRAVIDIEILGSNQVVPKARCIYVDAYSFAATFAYRNVSGQSREQITKRVQEYLTSMWLEYRTVQTIMRGQLRTAD